MAPAGNWSCLTAAAQAGAGSVYFGVGELNMRAHAAHNFKREDLPRIVQFCRKHHMRSYLTQLNISNIQALAYYAQYAEVIVLARELTLPQIAAIARQVQERNITGPSGKPVKLELFCHGALCMAVSGKCYLSLHEYNKSANRGACYQICRRSYTVQDNETGTQLVVDNKYIMSPGDLCTVAFLDKILEAGIDVLKIEGRARSAEYVKTTTWVRGATSTEIRQRRKKRMWPK